MNRKLIFLDIDGTLTSPGCNVPPDSALEAVRAARAAGHKVFLCSDEAQLRPAREALERDYYCLVQDMAAANCLNGEVINRRFDKGLGIRRVCEALGARLEDTVGFGDSMNDLEMIQTVGTSVCMANGSPRLQELSDLVCPSVEEDGLAEGFRRLGLI